MESVWTLDRITKTHKFLHENVKAPAKLETTADDFVDRKSMEGKLARYYMGPEARGKYSYAARLCGKEGFVEEVGKEGAHMIDVSDLWGGRLSSLSKVWSRPHTHTHTLYLALALPPPRTSAVVQVVTQEE